VSMMDYENIGCKNDQGLLNIWSLHSEVEAQLARHNRLGNKSI
jgi:hypothetical protein